MDRIHEAHVIERKTSERMQVFRRRFIKIQTTNRPDYLWPGIWSGMSKADKKKEKQEWASEEPKFDKARKLRGIYFIDLEDG